MASLAHPQKPYAAQVGKDFRLRPEMIFQFHMCSTGCSGHGCIHENSRSDPRREGKRPSDESQFPSTEHVPPCDVLLSMHRTSIWECRSSGFAHRGWHFN